MLLFFLTLFLNYDLFNCNQARQTKFNNTPPLTALIHKTIHEIDTLLRDFQQDIQKEKLWLRTDSDEKGNFKEDPGQFDNKPTPHWQGSFGNGPVGQNNPDATFLQTSGGFGVHSLPTAASTNNLWTDNPPRSFFKVLPGYVFPPKSPPELPFNSPRPPLTTFDHHDSPVPVTTKEFEVSSPYHALPEKISPAIAPSLMVQGASTGDRAVQKRIQGNRITPIPRILARTLSKAQAWVQNRRWTTTPTPGSNTSASSSGTAQALRTTVTLSTDTDFLFTTANTETPEEVIGSTTITPSTVAGNVLFGADKFTTNRWVTSPNKPYHDIMDATDEGYVVVYISELTKLLALKEEKDMQPVLGHAEPIVNKLLEENKLGFAGQGIERAAKQLSHILTSGYFDAGPLKRMAIYLNLLLKERVTNLSPEVNALIDYSDMMFDDSEGDPLFDALRDFEDFPNITNTAYQVCYNLLTRFIDPFRVLPDTERGQAVLDNVNKAILDRFGNRRWGGEVVRGGATPKLHLSRLKTRHTSSLNRRIIKKRRELNRTRNQKTNDNHRRQYYYQTTWFPILRSMLPITRHQKRFRVITPRQLWVTVNGNERRTRDFRRRLSRPTHPPNDMMEFFPRVRVESKTASRSPPPIVAASVEKHPKQALVKPLKQSINHRRPRRLKATLFRRSLKTQEQK